MSTDYDLKCRDCNEYVETVASASIAYGNKLWRTKENLDQLQEFLFKHHGHELVFVSEYHVEACNADSAS